MAEKMFNIQDLYWMTDYNAKGQPFLRMAYKDGEDYYFCTNGKKAEKDREIPYSFVVSMEKDGKTVYVVNDFKWHYNDRPVGVYDYKGSDGVPFNVVEVIDKKREQFKSKDLEEFWEKTGKETLLPIDMYNTYKIYANYRDDFKFLSANPEHNADEYKMEKKCIEYEMSKNMMVEAISYWTIEPKDYEDIPQCYVPKSCVKVLEEMTARMFDKHYTSEKENDRRINEAKKWRKDTKINKIKKMSAEVRDILESCYKEYVTSDGSCMRALKHEYVNLAESKIRQNKEKLPKILTFERFVGNKAELVYVEGFPKIVSVLENEYGGEIREKNAPKYAQKTGEKELQDEYVRTDDAKIEKR